MYLCPKVAISSNPACKQGHKYFSKTLHYSLVLSQTAPGNTEKLVLLFKRTMLHTVRANLGAERRHHNRR